MAYQCTVSATEQASIQLPRWVCNRAGRLMDRVVYADKIVHISFLQIDATKEYWVLECGGIVQSDDVSELMKHGSPVIGDYFVQYADGYKLWSSAKAFEAGYTRM